MEPFGLEEGGAGRYEAGLIALPDGSVRGVETVTRVDPRAGMPGLRRTTRTMAGSVRDALSGAAGLSLPLRLAASTVRAGLGAIEAELLSPEGVRVEIGFSDGTAIVASMSPQAAALIRRDAEIARGVLARAGGQAAAPPPVGPDTPPDTASGTAPDQALTSIFRYEKRNGRLRRVTAGKPES